ncbi:MAG: hypothetical protein HC936_01800 [Leptolyngbyaceae cyanobacterium SU_3_3]|nr:hypothetical protein [Leptolyngbyaceae cyanobacterium SU_3_3]NJR52140.1 hypothetical protein [Leptolyngbyaceae cyanobacterium CSU_1_3]
MTDFTAALVLPRLAERLEQMAASIDIRVKPSTNINVPELLDAGEIDFAIGRLHYPYSGIYLVRLGRKRWAIEGFFKTSGAILIPNWGC